MNACKLVHMCARCAVTIKIVYTRGKFINDTREYNVLSSGLCSKAAAGEDVSAHCKKHLGHRPVLNLSRHSAQYLWPSSQSFNVLLSGSMGAVHREHTSSLAVGGGRCDLNTTSMK